MKSVEGRGAVWARPDRQNTMTTKKKGDMSRPLKKPFSEAKFWHVRSARANHVREDMQGNRERGIGNTVSAFSTNPG